MPYITSTIDRRKNTKIETTQIPRARVWEILPGQINIEYEKFLDQQTNGEVVVVRSSGQWHDGIYRVQAHYFEVSNEERRLDDVDMKSDIENLKKIPPGKPEDEELDNLDTIEPVRIEGIIPTKDPEPITDKMIKNANSFDSGISSKETSSRRKEVDGDKELMVAEAEDNAR